MKPKTLFAFDAFASSISNPKVPKRTMTQADLKAYLEWAQSDDWDEALQTA